MSDEQLPQDQPDSEPSGENDFPFPELTPLEELSAEMHEVFTSLTGAGFHPQVGAWIIASMMSDAMDTVLNPQGDAEHTVEITTDEDDEDPAE